MKNSITKNKSHVLVIIVVILTGIGLSCENKIDSIPKSDLLTLPSITVKDFITEYTDSGKLQLVLSSSIMEQYDNATVPYSEFKSGIKVIYYNSRKEPSGSVTSKYAKYTKPNSRWELKDSVVVINENKDKLETELLYWDQDADLIHTDRFVKITNEDQIIQGFGFESDSHLNNRKIKKVNAIIYLKDEE
jgi:LPS export ABC transporter protein LptC